MKKYKLLVTLVCVVLNLPSFAKDGWTIGSIDVAALATRLKQLGVYNHEGALECESGAIAVDGTRLDTPTLRSLFNAKHAGAFHDDFIYHEDNVAYPSLLLELVKKSQDKGYAKKIAKQLLCEKIDLTSRTLDRKPSSGIGSMVYGGLDLLLSNRIDNEVPTNADDCHFSIFFHPDNYVGLVCDSYFVETPVKLKNILSKDLKISAKNAEALYEKIDKFISLMDDEITTIEAFQASCRSCIEESRLGEVELLVYRAVTIFRTGRPLSCADVRDGENPCSFSDYEAGILGPEEQQTYEQVDAELNRQWGLLKQQASAGEHWKILLDTQRAFVKMKVALVKSGSPLYQANSEKVATYLTKHRSARIRYLRELLSKN
jgi:hypothetical protein